MTAPATPLVTKTKTWIAAVGGFLTVAVPIILQVSVNLPEPWPGVVSGAIALLTVLGVYHAPYVKPDAAVVPAASGPPPIDKAWGER